MSNAKGILSRVGVFQGIDQEAVQALLDELETVHLSRRTTIFNEGGSGDRLYIIIDGKVKLARRSADGRENLLTIVGPSDVFGELSIFDPGPCTSSAVCVTEVPAAFISVNQLQEWVGSHPDVPAQLLRILARRLRRTNNSLADLIFTDVLGHIAKSLLQLANRFGVQEGSAFHVSHDLTQGGIVQLIGVSRETINKALTEFIHHGRIRPEGKSVFISDTEHLARCTR